MATSGKACSFSTQITLPILTPLLAVGAETQLQTPLGE